MTRFGPWRLGPELGRGAMGVVHVGVHEDSGARAAVKTLLDTGEAGRRGIDRELAALLGMAHPNVVRVLDRGVANGAPWYAMELLEGTSLSARVREDTTDQTVADPTGPWAPCVLAPPGPAAGDLPRTHRLLGWLAQVCHGLAYIHGRGVVHCDIKPANIVVTDAGRAVLVDFGVAARRRRRVEADVLRDAAHRAGTLRYLAPERILARPFDSRADLYSLGCMLYHALTGCHPFPQEGHDLLRAHLTQTPTPVRDHNPDVPIELALVVERLLAKEPEERVGSALVVLRVLASVGIDVDPLPDAPRPEPHLFLPPMVGRDSLRAQLVAAHAAVDAGRGRVLWLTGAVGIGKSRLATALVEEVSAARGGPVVVTGTARAGESMSLFSDLEIRAPELGDGDVGALERRSQLARLVEVALELRAPDGRLAVVLDDVQHADENSRACLDRLVSVAVRRGWFVLGVGGPAPPGVDALEVQALSDAQTTGMLHAALGGSDRDSDSVNRIVQWVVRRAEGNPLQATSWLHLALDSGWLRRDAQGYWRFRAPVAVLEHATAPDEVGRLLAQRLDALGPELRAMLRAVAVASDPEDAELVALVADCPVIDVQRGVSRLVEAGMLVERAGIIGFASPAVRDLAALGADPALHRRAVRALVPRGAHPARLAEHYAAAQDDERARDAHAEAARRALRDGGLVIAEHHLRAAIALHPAESLGRAALIVTLAERVLIPRGADSEALAAMDAILPGARGSVIEGSALQVRARARHRSGDAEHALADASRAVALADDSGNPNTAAAARRVLAGIAGELGDYQAARTAFDEAHELARQHGDDPGRARILRELSSLLLANGRHDEATIFLRQSADLADKIGDHFLGLDAQSTLGTALLARGDHAGARKILEPASAELRDLGLTGRAVGALNALGVVHSRARNLAAAETAFAEALDLTDSVSRRVQLRHNLATARLRVGRPRAALALLLEILPEREALGSGRGMAMAHSAVGQAALATGDYDAALMHFRHAAGHVQAMVSPPPVARDIAIGRGLALACLGKLDAATAALDACPQSDDATHRALLALARAQIEQRQGRYADADQTLAAIVSDELDAWVVLCRGVLARLGGRPEAGALLEMAQGALAAAHDFAGVAQCLGHRIALGSGADTTALEAQLAAIAPDIETVTDLDHLPVLAIH